MKQNKTPFKWRHFEPSLILLCVRWYCRYQLSYRDLEEMMRPRLKLSGTSYRIDETYVKVGGMHSTPHTLPLMKLVCGRG